MKTPSVARLALLFALGSAAVHAQYSFRGLGGPTTGSVLSTAHDVSDNGQVVAASLIVSGNFRASQWTAASGHVLLGDLPGGTVLGASHAASTDGSVIVGSAGSANGSEAFRWSAATGMVALGDLPGEGAFGSTARGVSGDGSVVAGVSQRAVSGAAIFRAFRWTAATGIVPLGDLPGGEVFSIATDVSADGAKIVGRSVSAAGGEAFVWTQAGGMVGLGDLPGGDFSSGAQAISADGTTIVGIAQGSSGVEAFRWTAATGMVGLGTLPSPSPSSQANDVSGNGNVIVGIGEGAGDAASGTAFVWFPNAGMLDLREYLLAHGVEAVRDWSLAEASGVSVDGRTIVGLGVNPQGAVEGWIATIEIDDTPLPPPPPPADAPETFAPASIAVTAGTLVSGNVASLQSSNNAYVTLQATARNPMQLTLDAQATRAAASQLRFAIETSAQGSATQQEIALFDFNANTWAVVDTRSATTADAIATVTIASNPTRFLHPVTRAVRARVTFTPSGTKRATTTVRIDQAAWTRTP